MMEETICKNSVYYFAESIYVLSYFNNNSFTHPDLIVQVAIVLNVCKSAYKRTIEIQ